MNSHHKKVICEQYGHSFILLNKKKLFEVVLKLLPSSRLWISNRVFNYMWLNKGFMGVSRAYTVGILVFKYVKIYFVGRCLSSNEDFKERIHSLSARKQGVLTQINVIKSKTDINLFHFLLIDPA